MFLDGYGPLILAGTWTTVQLGLLSLAGAIVLGLVGASMKLANSKISNGVAMGYTTLIRSFPDLVLMMLVFFSLQIWLNQLTDWLQVAQINIDPFAAGVVTLSFIYGAYFTETFRGAFMAVPRGQIEAATSCGMSKGMVFRRILFPLMMRFALPGIGNNWQVLIKSTALVSIIGLNDLLSATQDAGKGSMRFFYYSLICALIYLAITTVSQFVLAFLERRYAVGVRKFT